MWGFERGDKLKSSMTDAIMQSSGKTKMDDIVAIDIVYTMQSRLSTTIEKLGHFDLIYLGYLCVYVVTY